MYKNVTPFVMFWQAVKQGEVITLCCHIAIITTQFGFRAKVKFKSGRRQFNLADILSDSERLPVRNSLLRTL